MKTNITLSLDSRRKRKDGSCPIIFRLSHHRKTIAISSGISLPPEYWNEKKREVKKTYRGVSSVSRLNNMLTKKKIELRDEINKLEEGNRLSSLSVSELKSFLTKTDDTHNFFLYTKHIINELEEANRFGNARAYKSAYGALKNYYKKENLRFEEITYAFQKRFETWHLKEGTALMDCQPICGP